MDEALSHLTVYPPLDSPRYASPGPMATSFRGSAGSVSAAASTVNMAWVADVAAAACKVEELRLAADIRSNAEAEVVALEAKAAALQLYRGLVAEYREVVAVREAEEAAKLEAAAQASLVLGGDDASPIAIDLAYAAVQSHHSSSVAGAAEKEVEVTEEGGPPLVLMHDAAALEAALKATAADFSTGPAFLRKHQTLMAEKERREAATAAAIAAAAKPNELAGASKESSGKAPAAWDAIGQLLRQFSK